MATKVVKIFFYSSTNSKSSLVTPQSGQDQSSGIASNGVPGAIPLSGSPTAGSYIQLQTVHTYFFIILSVLMVIIFFLFFSDAKVRRSAFRSNRQILSADRFCLLWSIESCCVIQRSIATKDLGSIKWMHSRFFASL